MSSVLDQFLKWQQTLQNNQEEEKQKKKKKKTKNKRQLEVTEVPPNTAPPSASGNASEEPNKKRKHKKKHGDAVSSATSTLTTSLSTTTFNSSETNTTSTTTIITAASSSDSSATTSSDSSATSSASAFAVAGSSLPKKNPYLDEDGEDLPARSLWLKPRGKQGKLLFTKSTPASKQGQQQNNVNGEHNNSSKSKKQDEPRAPQRPWVGGAKPDKADGRKFLYGNYDRYYGYRNVDDFWSDARLPHFQIEWFLGKKVLDIGCNSGVMTILVAEKLECKSIQGLDVDLGLIYAARENLSKRTRLLQMQELLKKNEQFHAGSSSLSSSSTSLSSSSSSSSSESDSSTLSSEKYPDNVRFFRRDFMNDPLGTEIYEVIMCLSITKWIHYRSGDEGIKFLFEGIKQLLCPGGLLILEPQPWKNYRKKAHLTPEFLKNYQSIQLKPEQFSSYLCDELGFKLMHTIYLEETEEDKKKAERKRQKLIQKSGPQPETPKTSFTSRPVYVLQRGES